MEIITIISQAMDIARRRFTRGEQKMIIDIYNGAMLMPDILGQHLLGNVEDSFNLYPGMYKEKWGVNQKDMIEKIASLDPATAAFVELWAVGFWSIYQEAGGSRELEAYLSGELNLFTRLQEATEKLETALEKMEQSKTAFESGAIAAARAEAEKAKEILKTIR